MGGLLVDYFRLFLEATFPGPPESNFDPQVNVTGPGVSLSWI